MSNNYTISQPLIEKIPVVNYYKRKLSELSLNWNTLNFTVMRWRKNTELLTDSLVKI
jgi:hypothetical protein